jgi:hypothetical protein
VGTSNSITGSAVTYSIGGGANGTTIHSSFGQGGDYSSPNSIPSGTAGGLDGGDGVVIVAYLTADFSGYSYTGTSATGTDGSYTWVRMTTSGDLTLTAIASSPAPDDGLILFE